MSTSLSTRSTTRKAAFDYVFGTILDIDKDDLLLKALDDQGMKSMADLLNMTDQDITALTYDDTGTQKPLHRAKMNLIRILQAWNVYLLKTHGIPYVDWNDTNIITENE
jgi:succinate dehydrogenase flavin-adding protein (antitoxin of CptAB toxin-antitoxin module)